MTSKQRLMRCYSYHFSTAIKPLLVFLAVFAAVDFGLPLFASLFQSSGSNFRIYNGFTMLISPPFLVAGTIFLFVGGYASFREDFNFMIALNNTRRNQYWSNIFHALTLSCLFLVVSVIIGLFERFLAMVLTDQPFWKPGAIWSLPAIMSELIFPFGLFLAAYAFGQMGGLLSYRLGAAFTVTFWILFGTSYVIVPILSGSIPIIGQLLAWFAGVGTDWPLLHSGWHFAVLGLIFYAISGVAMHKLPQNA